MSTREVTLYVLQCDECGEDFNDSYTYPRIDYALEDAKDCEWLITDAKHTCYYCIRCEVCGDQGGYPVDKHGVCDEHKDHEFPAVQR